MDKALEPGNSDIVLEFDAKGACAPAATKREPGQGKEQNPCEPQTGEMQDSGVGDIFV